MKFRKRTWSWSGPSGMRRLLLPFFFDPRELALRANPISFYLQEMKKFARCKQYDVGNIDFFDQKYPNVNKKFESKIEFWIFEIITITLNFTIAIEFNCQFVNFRLLRAHERLIPLGVKWNGSGTFYGSEFICVTFLRLGNVGLEAAPLSERILDGFATYWLKIKNKNN